ncbi:hypothetical protein Strvi_7120 [Streptomyces violaceusniger Tu 4113]|uniref:Uncharacterized protein n=1 Tax=Streptomyces violaceusniger (strain Tu 4113) TaxID=653045 RepID=G2NW26_STRV4|nr:hypothetical protein Strvi_7120 [Streptomyces violaceusniger Tu 4113]
MIKAAPGNGVKSAAPRTGPLPRPSSDRHDAPPARQFARQFAPPPADPYWALAAGRTTISLTSTSAGWLMAYATASAIAEAGRATAR